MSKRSIFGAATWLLILTLMIILYTPQGLAETTSPPSGYNISMARDYISVSINTTWDQNITQIPPFSFTLEDTNSSTVTGILSKAIQSKTPSARVTELFLSASSNGTMSVIDLHFKVLGVSTSDQWGNLRADLAWRSFKVEDDIRVNGVALNLVGKHYLSEELLSLAASALNPTRLIRITFEVNGKRALPADIQAVAPNLNLLDFSQLAAPLDSKPTGFSLVRLTTTWNDGAGFDVLGTTRISEPLGGEVVIRKRAAYKLDVTLEAPGVAQVMGDTVIFGQSTLEPIMAGIVLLFPVAYIGAYLAERRAVSQPAFKRRKR